jgi:hypothetical protein
MLIASGRTCTTRQSAPCWLLRGCERDGTRDASRAFPQGQASRSIAGHARASQQKRRAHVAQTANERMAPTTTYPPPLAEPEHRRQRLKVGAVCGKAARTVLCGGREVTRVPTASGRSLALHFAAPQRNRSSRLRSTYPPGGPLESSRRCSSPTSMLSPLPVRASRRAWHCSEGSKDVSRFVIRQFRNGVETHMFVSLGRLAQPRSSTAIAALTHHYAADRPGNAPGSWAKH